MFIKILNRIEIMKIPDNARTDTPQWHVLTNTRSFSGSVCLPVFLFSSLKIDQSI